MKDKIIFIGIQLYRYTIYTLILVIIRYSEYEGLKESSLVYRFAGIQHIQLLIHVIMNELSII